MPVAEPDDRRYDPTCCTARGAKFASSAAAMAVTIVALSAGVSGSTPTLPTRLDLRGDNCAGFQRQLPLAHQKMLFGRHRRRRYLRVECAGGIPEVDGSRGEVSNGLVTMTSPVGALNPQAEQ